ncbi:hypothetical protein SJAG_04112 [Schizosaccharomyces japonicus yFS275]|uniref:Got1 family protein n=1 Tax=Schizosaccharomyces japonicus (strain yFS275 / FY16936) TaxID=402676 RepID=B6K5Y6_SCHJY|nr:hypothetical protein SJAG_04112 [Schizosaccharomyces japonicus yFS275]EEB08940.1 hypothetical protein SJAG_04112 [Schizosaccharomyces japonicus yFS275]
MWLSDLQKIGASLTALGLLFFVIGLFMLFDGPFLSLGNILLMSGISLLMGISRMSYFFLRKEKALGTIGFFTGALLIFFHFPIAGFFIQLFGFINLFSSSFPLVKGFLRGVPFLGPLLNQLTHYRESPV